MNTFEIVMTLINLAAGAAFGLYARRIATHAKTAASHAERAADTALGTQSHVGALVALTAKAIQELPKKRQRRTPANPLATE